LHGYCPIICGILYRGNGKISLCGGSIVDILQGNIPKDWDFFFHSVATEEADRILNNCLQYIKDNNDITSTVPMCYKISQAVLTVEFTCKHTHTFYKIQFIKRIYENKDHVLMGFDLAPCRMGFNLNDGFFATVCGGLSFALRAFPLEPKNLSSYHKYRLLKYLNKGFSILLPGLEKNFSYIALATPHGIIERYNGINIKDFLTGKVTDEFFKFREEIADEILYDSKCSDNILAINRGMYQALTFKVFDLEDINRFSDRTITDCVNQNGIFGDLPRNMSDLDNKNVKEFLGDKAEDFVVAFYAKKDKETYKRIWKERCFYYLDKAKECAELCKKNPWKYENIKDPLFGRFAECLNDPRKWYGEHYQPIVVGISNERLQALIDCCKNINYMNIPKETFKIICDYWLEGEVQSARKRLKSMSIERTIGSILTIPLAI
jgi:hypothetical protein